ncbi:hypothetical protein G0U57_016957, partial [Chelydra serpentina]
MHSLLTRPRNLCNGLRKLFKPIIRTLPWVDSYSQMSRPHRLPSGILTHSM